MRRVLVRSLAGVAFAPATASHAADALKFAPPPAWVHQQTVPEAKPTDAAIALLLDDEQIEFDRGKVTSYHEGAVKIQNSQGLGAGNLSIVWQPATDTVTVNKLQIIRGDKVIDVLASGQTFTTLRRETNLDAATLDGTLTATIQPEGLQEGDIIDLATTTERSDPVLKGHVEAMFGAWNGVSVQRAHATLTWPSGLHVNFKETPNLPTAQKSVVKGNNVVEFSSRDVEPLVPPKGAPDRFLIGRLAEASDFGSWTDLADSMMPLFRDASVIPASGPLHEEVEKIRSSTTDPSARAQQALALVQDRIRYVALLMGQGGYVPASADETWARRFGDCKAKTALLLGILHALGIEAEPVLVQTKLGDMIPERLPMIALFNHVLVRAHIGNRDYWLDGTRTGDTDLSAIQVPDFGWGLPLVEHAALVRLVPPPLEKPESELELAIDASSGVYASAPASADQIIRGDAALEFESQLAAATKSQRDEFFRTYWSSALDFITFKSGTFSFEKNKRELHLTMSGDAKLDWSDGYFHVPDSSVGYRPEFDRQQGDMHDAPFAVAFPNYKKWIVRVKLPAGFMGGRKLGTADLHETLAGTEYSRTATVEGDTLIVDTSERSVVPEISYRDAKVAEPRLIALSDEDVALPLPNSYRTTNADVDAIHTDDTASASDLVMRGNSLLSSGKLDDAIVQFTKALSLNAKDATALADRGIAYVWARKRDLAKKDIEAAQSIEPDNAIAFRALALQAEFDSECASSVDFYAKSLKSEPGNSFALGHKAICESILHRDTDALSDIDASLKQSSSWTQLRFLRVELLLRLGRKDEAVEEAELAVKAGTDGPASGWLAIAKIFKRNGMQTQALDAIDHAIAIKPSASLYVEKASLRPLHDFAGRMADIEAGLKLDPTDFSAIAAKADLVASNGNRQRALAIYDAAIKKQPGLSPLTLNRAILLYESGRKSEAERSITEWRALAGTASELALLCSRKANAGILLESAEKDCNEALQKNATFAEAIESLGLVELRLEKWDAAIDQYDRAIKDGESATSYMGRAIAFARKGDMIRAKADRAKALGYDPDVEAKFAQFGLTFETQRIAATEDAKSATN